MDGNCLIPPSTLENIRDWVFNNYALDDVLFLSGPTSLTPVKSTVIGAHDVRQCHSSQIVLRTERWSLRNARQPTQTLEQKFDAVLADAQARGLTSVWLFYRGGGGARVPRRFGGKGWPAIPAEPDYASLGALANAPQLGGGISMTKAGTWTFDRTQWVLTIWFPFALGYCGEPALWPNTPPFPQPYEGGKVCEVSRRGKLRQQS